MNQNLEVRRHLRCSRISPAVAHLTFRGVWVILVVCGIVPACAEGAPAQESSPPDGGARRSARPDGGAPKPPDSSHRQGTITLPPGAACTNEACTSANDGAAAICSKAGHCLPLLTSECPQLEGPYRRDDAFIVPVLGGQWNAASLAALEINGALSGMPAGDARPLVVLRCSSEQIDLPRVMDHLINDLALPGVIPSDSAELVARVAERAVPAGMFILATLSAPPLTHLVDEGLLWHAGPSQALCSSAMALSVEDIEANRLARGLKGPLRVVAMTVDIPEITSIQDDVLARLQVNGHGVLDAANRDNFKVIKHPSLPGYSFEDFANLADDILAFAPHIVLGFGIGESPGIALALETAWTRDDYRPEYVFSSQNRGEFWLQYISAEVAPRMRGVYSPYHGPGFPAFVHRYEQRFAPPQSSGYLPNYGLTYDAVYAVVYAAAAANWPATGRALADGMTKLLPPGPTVDVGPGDDGSNIQEAIARLKAGEGIDLRGVSSPLDLDPETGEPTKQSTPIAIWCVGGSNGLEFVDVQRYDVATDSLQGRYDCSDAVAVDAGQ